MTIKRDDVDKHKVDFSDIRLRSSICPRFIPERSCVTSS